MKPRTNANGGSAAPLGVRLIVTYKFAKAGVQLCLGVLFLVLSLTGLTMALHAHAVELGQKAAHIWSTGVAWLLLRATTQKFMHLMIAALFGDAIISFFEGIVLQRGLWWAPWLIVIATGSLLPLEIIELARHPHIGHLIVLAINVAIVIYLARRASRQ